MQDYRPQPLLYIHPVQEQEKPTPYRHKVSHISLTSPHPIEAEGKLLTDTASNSQTSFHTTLQIITNHGTKPISVKVNPGTDVNTIPLSHYKKLFRKNFTKVGHLKHNVLHPTNHLWSLHDSKPQQFIGYFIVNFSS